MNCVLEKPFHAVVCLSTLVPLRSYWNHVSCIFHCFSNQFFSWNVYSLSNCMKRDKGCNAQSRLIIRYYNYYFAQDYIWKKELQYIFDVQVSCFFTFRFESILYILIWNLFQSKNSVVNFTGHCCHVHMRLWRKGRHRKG